jgi:hypothetical protein
MKLKISRKNFEKSSTMKFHENPSSGSRRTDIHDETNSRFSQVVKVSKNKNEKTFILVNAETPDSTNITQSTGKNVNKKAIYIYIYIYIERERESQQMWNAKRVIII